MPNIQSEVKKNLKNQITLLNQVLENIDRTKNRLLSTTPLLLKTLEDLDEASDLQHEMEKGIEKPMSKDEFTEFQNFYNLALKACAQTLKTIENPVEIREDDPNREKKLEGRIKMQEQAKPVTDIIRTISESLAKDMRALDLYKSKNEPVSFQQLLSEASPLTLEIGSKNLGTVGEALSKRIPFNYTLPDGKEAKGVFTPKKLFNPQEDYMSNIRKTDDNISGFSEFMTNYYNAFKEVYGLDGKKALHDFRGYFALTNRGTQEKPMIDVKTVEEFKNNIEKLADKITDREKREALKKEFKELETLDESPIEPYLKVFLKNTYSIAMGEAVNQQSGISQGSRIDSRNTAMSTVADMLGVPNLLAKSKPMTIKYQGKELEGTFMEKGIGMDHNHPTEAAKTYTQKNFQTDGLKSVSDLQVLDLICGNTDRHIANLLYQFDTKGDPENHKFLGVQGIDNDTSFGTVDARNGIPSKNRFPTVQSLSVISKSMANTVEGLNVDEFKLKLRGLDLTDEQINSAGRRLEELQHAIAQGRSFYSKPENQNDLKKQGKQFDGIHLRIIPDNQFSNLNLGDFTSNNLLFSNIKNFSDGIKNKVADGKDLQTEKVNEQLGYVQKPEELENINKRIDQMERVNDFRGTSPQFEAMQTALKKFKSFCEDHNGEVLSPAEYDIRLSHIRGITIAGKAYLQHKGILPGDDGQPMKNPPKLTSYAQKRIDLVSSITMEYATMFREADKNFYRDKFKNHTMSESEKSLLNKYTGRADAKLHAKKMAQDNADPKQMKKKKEIEHDNKLREERQKEENKLNPQMGL